MQSKLVYYAIEHYFMSTHVADNKVEAMVACFAKDSVCHNPAEGSAIYGQDELRRFFQSMADLFQEITLTATFISVNGNEVAAKWTGQGISKSGKSATFEGIDVFEVNEDGKIQTMKAYWNPAAISHNANGLVTTI